MFAAVGDHIRISPMFGHIEWSVRVAILLKIA